LRVNDEKTKVSDGDHGQLPDLHVATFNQELHAMDPQNDVMTVEEVAAFLKVSKQTIERQVLARKILAWKVGRQWRFSRRAIEQELGVHDRETAKSLIESLRRLLNES
jgi:excisionase family DNA binding protein